MSCYIVKKEVMDTIVQATNYVLEQNARYSASYPLSDSTLEIFGKYAGDLHGLYRALYIANLKAYNGRYDENVREFPRYTSLKAWDNDRASIDAMRDAADKFGEYCYQIAEDPIRGSALYKAIYNIRGILCMILVAKEMRIRREEW